ncbi:ABC transporter permease [Shimia sp. R10_1]|uniref:ABC transporter permease n=1 Tax=Shimia sp. R10_1 TaxID=2821095 RepID=UPI001ADA2864|nr:ABC transporter permease [Shimia sp. R10_1]MBO9474989.1 ABC transporter permease [Shimia sp. R10_1]
MLQAIWLQMRVVASLTLRETRMTFGTSHVGYLWAIAQPVISVGFMVGLFYLIGRQAPFGASLALFFATAVLTLDLYNKLSVSLMRAFTTNKSLLSYPMIKEPDTLFARLTLIALTFLVINALVYGGLMAMGWAELPAHPERLIYAFGTTCFLGFGVGAINALLYQRTQAWQHVEKLIARPLFFLSGVFYIPSTLPPEAVAVLKWNPLLHIVEWTREGFYTNYRSDVLNIAYPLSLAATLVIIALFAERITRKQRA